MWNGHWLKHLPPIESNILKDSIFKFQLNLKIYIDSIEELYGYLPQTLYQVKKILGNFQDNLKLQFTYN